MAVVDVALPRSYVAAVHAVPHCSFLPLETEQRSSRHQHVAWQVQHQFCKVIPTTTPDLSSNLHLRFPWRWLRFDSVALPASEQPSWVWIYLDPTSTTDCICSEL